MSRQIEPIIETESAYLDFGNGAGILDISFNVCPGTILGMIGPSGCGKTTLVRTLTGMYRPTSGRVRVFNKAPIEFDDADKMRIGYIPQRLILYNHLTTEENLHFFGSMYGMSLDQRRARIDQMLEFVDLLDARTRRVDHLSGGMRRRLMLASALLHDPTLIFADEPTAGIDPILRTVIWKNFRQLSEAGRTLVITTQIVSEAAYCDLVAVMRKGRILTIDTPMGLRRQAVGGEIISLQIDSDRIFHAMEFLNSMPKVHRVEQADRERGEIFVIVEDAGRELPVLLNALREGCGITPWVAEPRLLPFDDVFVRLVQHTEGFYEPLAD